jgi:hypothetical protein
LASLCSSLSSDDLSFVSFSSDSVLSALKRLKPCKSDGSSLSSNHFIHAAPVIAPLLASVFTAVVRHGYIPECLRDCTLVPIPKGQKDPSISDNYRPIALAPTLSKVLEWCILLHYSSYMSTSGLQFGFKQGFSTTLATGLIKNVVGRYLHRGSHVYGCFLDASKAFDLVDHGILFTILAERKLPLPVLRLLVQWYTDQQMKVCWNHSLSDSFSVSNGVRQGGVLSPVLFTVYIDELLGGLQSIGVGCHWKSLFVGAVCYADDLALLAPSPAALRLMLRFCEDFAVSHGLNFNSSKTQLIRFGRCKSSTSSDLFLFCDSSLSLLDSVTHLGHVISYDLDDSEDVILKSRDMVRKANCMLRSFLGTDISVKMKLLKSFCLSLYGSVLWNLSCRNLRIIEVAFNGILRRIWNVPSRTHTAILHCLAGLTSIYNVVFARTKSLLESALMCSSDTVKTVFSESASLVYTFLGYNLLSGSRFLKVYSHDDYVCASVIRNYRLSYGIHSPFEDVIDTIACS